MHRPPPTHRRLGFAAAVAVLVADQLLKWMASGPWDLPTRGVWTLLPIFDLRWVQNYGVSMGYLTADGEVGRWLLVALTAAIATGVTAWLWRERNRADALALGLVLGGALGNIADRARLGYVVDFLDLHVGDWHPFLVFNLGDVGITVGVLLLVLRAFLARGPRASEDVHA